METFHHDQIAFLSCMIIVYSCTQVILDGMTVWGTGATRQCASKLVKTNILVARPVRGGDTFGTLCLWVLRSHAADTLVEVVGVPQSNYRWVFCRKQTSQS